MSGRSEVSFEPPLDVARAGTGRFTVTSHPEMGTLSGPYRATLDGEVTRLTIDIDSVAPPRQRGLLYRLIINERSMFATWPKGYHFNAVIDRGAGTIRAAWTNEQEDA